MTQSQTQPDWQLACPRCRHGLGAAGAADESVACPGCATTYVRRDGVWRLLSPDREEFYVPFLRDYHIVRAAEGRGSDDPAYYHRLPEPTPGDPLAGQWQIRRRTFDHFRRSVLPRLGRGLRVLDLGAGVGWLSHHLARLGHFPCAVDLSTDARDGLGAARHYAPAWPRLQAEFDRLPLTDGQADLVVFNASFHYSTDYRATLREALRVLTPAGRVVILESPLYRHDHSGRQMVAERHAAFERQYGTRSDALPSVEYLTDTMLADLGRELGLSWRRFTPWYGWRWALRGWVAWWKGKREPSRFVILVAVKTDSS